MSNDTVRFGTNIDKAPHGYEYRRKAGSPWRRLCRKKSATRESRIREQLLQRLEGYRAALEAGANTHDVSGYFLSEAQKRAASALSAAMGHGVLP